MLIWKKKKRLNGGKLYRVRVNEDEEKIKEFGWKMFFNVFNFRMIVGKMWFGIRKVFFFF